MRPRRALWIAAALPLFCCLAFVRSTSACSCAWAGPFLEVASTAPAIVRVAVEGFHGGKREAPEAIDVRLVETLRGATPQPRFRIWCDTGALCRPRARDFPISTEWLIGLDAPGCKKSPGEEHAISVCGQYWLRVDGAEVVGNVDDPSGPQASQRAPLDITLARLRARLDAETAGTSAHFIGEVVAGARFERPFGGPYRFVLEPTAAGWLVVVREDGRDEDLARLTPPLHFSPNPREIEGWHFRNADNTGPNEAGEKNVNAPGEVREFIFSPAVGRTIDPPNAGRAVTPEDVDLVRAYGRGTLILLGYELDNLEPGTQATVKSMRFEVVLSQSDD
jgi:hypothetical protein